MYRIEDVGVGGLDVQAWNELLIKSEICDAFQTYEWAEALKNSMGILPYFLMLYDKQDPVGGVMYFKKKMLGTLDCYEVRGGPLFTNANKLQVMKEVIKAFEEKRKRSAYVLFFPNPLINLSLRRLFESGGYHRVLFRTLLIDLNRPLDVVWKALDKDARRGVRKAQKLGVEATVANTWQEWKEYYNLHVLHSREKNYPPEPYSFYKELFKLHHKNMSRLFIAKLEKQVIAGNLCLIHRENLIGIRGASLGAYLKYQPNNLAHWKSIEWAKENGVRIYDFDGLPLEETKYLRGVYNYKKRWDGHVQWCYYYLSRRFLPSVVHLVRTSFVGWKLFSNLRSRRVVPT